MKFEPKDRRSFRRLINNIYVKNIPQDKTQEDVTDMFKPFGHIKSLVINANNIGQFAFICYDDPANQNKEYGPQCAQKAIDEMNDREIAPGVKLVVKHALKINRHFEAGDFNALKIASMTISNCSLLKEKNYNH